MNKIEEFKLFLEKELGELTRLIVFNRNPVSIEFHKGDFFSKVVNEYVRLSELPAEAINPEIPKEELVAVAKQIRRFNRKSHRIKKKVKLTEL